MSAQPPSDPTTPDPWARPASSAPTSTGPSGAPPVGPASASPLGAPPPLGPSSVAPPATPARPKRRWAPIIAGAVGAIVAAIAVTALRSGSDAMPSVDKWTSFADPGGRFTVAMPKQPEKTTQQASAGTLSLDVISYTASYGDSAVVVGYTDYPADLDLGASGDVLQGAAQGAAEATKGTLVSSAPTTVAGRPALDAEIQGEKGRTLSRFVLDGHRLYVLTTAAKESRSDVQRHLTDTFTLTGAS